MVGATVSMMTGTETNSSKINSGFQPANAEFEVIGGPGMIAMTFNPNVDPEALPDIAREQCGSHKICKVIGWTNRSFAARAMPMTDREVEAQAFQYTLNRNTGFEQVLWDCGTWARLEKDECL